MLLAGDFTAHTGGELAAQGMSARAIAPVVGTSYDTVQRDIKSADRFLSPAIHENEPPIVTGMDGKQYKPRAVPTSEPDLPEPGDYWTPEPDPPAKPRGAPVTSG